MSSHEAEFAKQSSDVPEARTVALGIMENVTTLEDHTLVAHRLSELRSLESDQNRFGSLVSTITSALAHEAFRNLPSKPVLIDTPVLAGAPGTAVLDEIVVVPILRAGLGMVPAIQEALPSTRLACVGLKRNEATLQPDLYFDGLPGDLTGVTVVICDPMLATGGSLGYVAAMVQERGASKVVALCILASQEGLARFVSAHPNVKVVVAAVDPELNNHGYIVPGLGDAGDRLFGLPVR